MLNRAMQLITSVEKGTTLGAAMQTILAGDLSFKGELLMALNFKGIARRVFQSDTTMTAMALSSHAMDALCSSDKAMALIGNSSTTPTRALSILLGQDMSVGKVFAYWLGLDWYTYTGATYFAQLPSRVSSIMNNATVRSLFLGNTIACKAVLDQNNQSTNAALNSVFGLSAYAGQYLNRLRIAEGLSSDAALSARDLATIAGSTTNIASIVASVYCMNAIADSSTARAAISSASAFMTNTTSSAMAAKWLTGTVGIDPRGVSSLTELGNNNTILAAIEANSVARSFIATGLAATLQDELMAVGNFRTFVNGSTNLLAAIKASEQANTKLLLATMGLSSAGYITYNGVARDATVAPAFITTSTGRMLLYNNDGLLNAYAAWPDAMTLVRSSPSHQVVNWTENGGTAVTVPFSSLPGTAYIITGASRSTTTSRTDTYTTLRAGSTISPTCTTGTTSNTLGQDSNVMIPVTTPISAKLNNSGIVPHYTGMLRCDA